MNNRPEKLVVPVEYVQAMFPWTELVGGEKLVTPSGDVLPVVELRYHPNLGNNSIWEAVTEWPTPIRK